MNIIKITAILYLFQMQSCYSQLMPIFGGINLEAVLGRIVKDFNDKNCIDSISEEGNYLWNHVRISYLNKPNSIILYAETDEKNAFVIERKKNTCRIIHGDYTVSIILSQRKCKESIIRMSIKNKSTGLEEISVSDRGGKLRIRRSRPSSNFDDEVFFTLVKSLASTHSWIRTLVIKPKSLCNCNQ